MLVKCLGDDVPWALWESERERERERRADAFCVLVVRRACFVCTLDRSCPWGLVWAAPQLWQSQGRADSSLRSCGRPSTAKSSPTHVSKIVRSKQIYYPSFYSSRARIWVGLPNRMDARRDLKDLSVLYQVLCLQVLLQLSAPRLRLSLACSAAIYRSFRLAPKLSCILLQSCRRNHEVASIIR